MGFGGSGGVSGGGEGLGQYPQDALHLLLNSCFLQFSSLSSTVFNSSWQKSGSASLHTASFGGGGVAGGIGGGEGDTEGFGSSGVGGGIGCGVGGGGGSNSGKGLGEGSALGEGEGTFIAWRLALLVLMVTRRRHLEAHCTEVSRWGHTCTHSGYAEPGGHAPQGGQSEALAGGNPLERAGSQSRDEARNERAVLVAVSVDRFIEEAPVLMAVGPVSCTSR